MKTIYIRRLDGEIQEIKGDDLESPIVFYISELCKIVTTSQVYIVPTRNIEIIADYEEEVMNIGL